MKMTIILISKSGLPTALRIREEFPESEIITTTDAGGCTRVPAYDSSIKQAFQEKTPLVFIGAMGICVRLICPYIQDKYRDPAVLNLDTSGRYVVPVLSGHIGGANELAVRVASAIGAEAVVTTQSDRSGLWALDTLGKRYGWEAVPHFPGSSSAHDAMNRLIALFVNREPTLLAIEARVSGTEDLIQSAPDFVHIHRGIPSEETCSNYKLVLRISPFLHEESTVPSLSFIPKVWHIGLGLARQASPAGAVIQALRGVLLEKKLHPQAIKCWATIEAKRDEPVVQVLQEQGFPLQFFSAEALAEVPVPTPSQVVEQYMGTPSVSEAAALLSSGGGELVLPKQKGENYTIAIAAEQGILHPEQGHIEIVGAGPGDPGLISVRGRRFLEQADLILYAGSLVPRELTLCAKAGAVVRSSAPMTLEEQFALMKEYYDQGKFIVRLHTGDPCIYGAIEEQMNYFDRYGMSYHITPGISSFQAAAAELRSQFTIPEQVQTIILTRGEGRTPMPEREKLHLLARSRSTMCIFLSASIVENVQEELLMEYPEDTPVAVCYHLTWRDQRIFRGRLKELASLVRDNNLTLTTMIVVGDAIGNRSGQSRLYAGEFKHLFRK